MVTKLYKFTYTFTVILNGRLWGFWYEILVKLVCFQYFCRKNTDKHWIIIGNLIFL